MQIINIFIQTTALIFFAILLHFLKSLINIYKDKKIEEIKALNGSNLQREAYFREISGKDLSKLFKDWTAMLYDLDRKIKKFGTSEAIDLISRTVIYGSRKTIFLCAGYMKHIYINKSLLDPGNTSDEAEYSKNKQILYVAYIVASLKFDFTNYEIDPLKLLEIKIDDLDQHKRKPTFVKAHKEIEEYLKSYKLS